MVESNGSLKPANGSAHVNGKPNGQAVIRRKPIPKGQSFLGWAFHAVARYVSLLQTFDCFTTRLVLYGSSALDPLMLTSRCRFATWAAILTILFRCPSSLEACDDTSSAICKPYFQLKNAVTPHVQPYYEQYASPYVERVRPYYETADSKIWKPARTYAVQYGAPWVEKGRVRARAQWEKNAQPQLARFQGLAQEKYDDTVAPYVNQAGVTVGPYYEIARTNALQAYYEYVLPSYQFVHPYAAQGYDVASEFATTTALPTAYWAWNKTYVFLDTAVWPQLRVVYLENVEPQLVRIGERLGRYKTRDAKSIYDNATEQ